MLIFGIFFYKKNYILKMGENNIYIIFISLFYPFSSKKVDGYKNQTYNRT